MNMIARETADPKSWQVKGIVLVVHDGGETDPYQFQMLSPR